jgi:hypothetical protein
MFPEGLLKWKALPAAVDVLRAKAVPPRTASRTTTRTRRRTLASRISAQPLFVAVQVCWPEPQLYATPPYVNVVVSDNVPVAAAPLKRPVSVKCPFVDLAGGEVLDPVA